MKINLRRWDVIERMEKNEKDSTLSELPEAKQKRIREIKEQWWKEISDKFAQWDKDPQPGLLDEHLSEQHQIEQKYLKMIEKVMQEK